MPESKAEGQKQQRSTTAASVQIRSVYTDTAYVNAGAALMKKLAGEQRKKG
jgi:hypothetical protein